MATPGAPEVWDGNFAGAVTDADAAIAELDAQMTHSRWRVVRTDALTPPKVEATLALRGFVERVLTVEMVSERAVVAPAGARIDVHSVGDESGWVRFAALLRTDHHEGARTRGPIADHVSEGLLAEMRGKAPACRFELIEYQGETVGYGSRTLCPNGLGMIESLFVLPAWRRRGIMSAYIAYAAAALHREGANRIFLDAYPDGTAARLYAALGFAPVALARAWVLERLA